MTRIDQQLAHNALLLVAFLGWDEIGVEKRQHWMPAKCHCRSIERVRTLDLARCEVGLALLHLDNLLPRPVQALQEDAHR